MPSSALFISSVQKELSKERRAIKAFVEGDALLRRYFTVFLFEDLPASDRRADAVYLAEVDRCALYVGIFGQDYGFENTEGMSPTEREFDQATQRGKPRLIFVKGADDRTRHAKMRALIHKVGTQLIRRRFNDVPELHAALYASLVEHLERTGQLRTTPFDAAACRGATLADLSDEKLRWFLARARHERQFALAENTSMVEALTHLNLLEAGQPTHSAVLLFGRNPQRFLISSELKCLHFHGTEVRKPIPSYQIYKGTVFDLVDQAVDFVMSKISRGVGTRTKGAEAPVEYELPRAAVAEAIVNAVVHRDYASNASVQVMLLGDRLEVWNPGQLPPALTMEKLRAPHASIPYNPLICESMFLARYTEKAGTGILDMIALCREAGLPEPTFHQDGGQFVQTLWRDWLQPEVLINLDINDRQRKAIAHVRANVRIGNTEYQKLTGSTKKTASRDLEGLVQKAVFAKLGSTGRGTYYVLRKSDIRNRGVQTELGGTHTAQSGPKTSEKDRTRTKRTKNDQTGSKGDIKGTKGTKRTKNERSRSNAAEAVGNRTNRIKRGHEGDKGDKKRTKQIERVRNRRKGKQNQNGT